MTLTYIGRTPDADLSVVRKDYADTRYATVKVDTAYVNNAVATEATGLVLPSYVDAGDATRAKKADVDAADANYVLQSDRGATNGVASTDINNFIPSAQLPTVQTSRLPVFKDVDTTSLTGNQQLTVVGLKGFQAASLTIADPGFPYVPLAFAMVQGGSINGTQNANGLGTGNYGQISILRSTDDVKFGWMVTSGQKQLDFHTVVPFGTLNTVPAPINGSLTLNLWLGLYGGTTYTFNPTGLQFWAIAYPAM